MTSLNPVFPVGEQIGEVLRLHMGMTPGQAAARAVELLYGGGHPRPAAAREELPARALRRPAAARDDRDGDRLRAQAPHRRRADHRARRHDPEADPRPDRRAAGEAPHVGALHHPRPRRGGRDRRPRGGDAERRDPGAGRRSRAIFERAAASLHEGAARVPPAPGPAPDAAAGDRGLHDAAAARAELRGAPARREAGRRRDPRGEEPRQDLLPQGRALRQARRARR